MKPIAMLLLIAVAFTSAGRLSAQIEKYTLGVEMCCPYGIGECWTIVRDGLERFDGIESISDTAHIPEKTGEFQMKNGRLVDVPAVAALFRQHRIPADIRGLEITAIGTVHRSGKQFWFNVPGNASRLELAVLDRKIQWNSVSNQRQTPSAEERSAFARLQTQRMPAMARVRVTGPLVKRDDGVLSLEVRSFEWVTTDAVTPIAGKQTPPGSSSNAGGLTSKNASNLAPLILGTIDPASGVLQSASPSTKPQK